MAAARSGSKKKKKTKTRQKSTAKPARRKTAKKTASTARKPARKATRKAVRKARKEVPADRSTLGISPSYLKALAEYEKAMAVFHKRDFAKAQMMFEQIHERHAGERDLADRARVYANLCRQQQQEESKPEGFDEHYYRGVVLMNQADYDAARALFEQALSLREDSGKVHYSLAACHAQMGDMPRALEALRRSLDLDPDGRLQARNDDDFLPLKGTPEFDEIVGLAEREQVE